MNCAFAKRRWINCLPSAIIALCVCASFSAAHLSTQLPAVQSPAADAKPTDQIPPARALSGREIAQTMHYLGAPWLVRESRKREEDCSTMLKKLNITPGQTVCDMGCGNGFYTLKLSPMVGDRGQVLAVDIQPEMLHLLDEQTKEAKLTNIKPILGSLIDPHCPREKSI